MKVLFSAPAHILYEPARRRDENTQLLNYLMAQLLNALVEKRAFLSPQQQKLQFEKMGPLKNLNPRRWLRITKTRTTQNTPFENFGSGVVAGAFAVVLVFCGGCSEAWMKGTARGRLVGYDQAKPHTNHGEDYTDPFENEPGMSFRNRVPMYESGE